MSGGGSGAVAPFLVQVAPPTNSNQPACARLLDVSGQLAGVETDADILGPPTEDDRRNIMALGANEILKLNALKRKLPTMEDSRRSREGQALITDRGGSRGVMGTMERVKRQSLDGGGIDDSMLSGPLAIGPSITQQGASVFSRQIAGMPPLGIPPATSITQRQAPPQPPHGGVPPMGGPPPQSIVRPLRRAGAQLPLNVPWFNPSGIHEIEVRYMQNSAFKGLTPLTQPSSLIPASSASGASTSENVTRKFVENVAETGTAPPGSADAPGLELKASLPNRCQQWYMTARNSLIDAYRATYPQKIALSDCRRLFDGDLATISRLYSFLCEEGLINYNESTSKVQIPPESTGEDLYRHLIEALPGGEGSWNSSGDSSLNILDFSQNPSCWACNKICLLAYYVIPGGITMNGKSPVWCSECQRESPFAQYLARNMSIGPLLVDGVKWGEKRIEKLLDVVEALGGDWVAVGQHMTEAEGSLVSPQQCLTAFLKLYSSSTASMTSSQQQRAQPLMKTDMLEKVSLEQRQQRPSARIRLAHQILNEAVKSVLVLKHNNTQNANTK